MEIQQYHKALDKIEEGVIVVNKFKAIQYMNKSAMRLFGIDLSRGTGHPAGSVKEGDIVIAACNYVGIEDELSKEDMELIGVNTDDVNIGDAVIVIGQLGSVRGSAILKRKPMGIEDRVMEYECLYNNDIPMKVSVNEINHVLKVEVLGEKYITNFQKSNNMMVVIDQDTKKVAFYQSPGYSLRGEDTGSILRGKPFVGKGKYASIPDMKGAHISLIKPDDLCVDCINKVLSDECEEIKEHEYTINTIYVKFSVYQIKDENGDIIGCTLVFSDISDVKRLQRKLKAREIKKNAFLSIIGNSKLLIDAKEMAHKVAFSKSTVLLLGESGTGKGLFARAIHNNSNRAEKPFVAINMAAIPPTLLESELFGYEEGAFTGARKAGKPGKFQLADNGTIFLDEIGDLDHSLQAKLLQVLQERKIYPVGAIKPIDVDVRVIAATHKNLEEEVGKGTFREDLFYRLNVISIEIPPLRLRKEDIKDLLTHMLPRLNTKVGKRIKGLEEDVHQVFLAYDWPGNVRELENVLESALNISDNDVITMKDLPKRFIETIKKYQKCSDNSLLSIKTASAIAERQAIETALKITNGNRTEAAKLLNIGRTAFYNKLKRYEISDKRSYM